MNNVEKARKIVKDINERILTNGELDLAFDLDNDDYFYIVNIGNIKDIERGICDGSVCSGTIQRVLSFLMGVQQTLILSNMLQYQVN